VKQVNSTQDISKAVAYARLQLPPGDTAKYDWNKTRAIAEGNTLLGWQIQIKQAG
jgi:hypothetical protein